MKKLHAFTFGLLVFALIATGIGAGIALTGQWASAPMGAGDALASVPMDAGDVQVSVPMDTDDDTGDDTDDAQVSVAVGAGGAWQIKDQFGGAVYAVAHYDDYVVLGVGPRILLLDVSQPGQPQVLGQTPVLPGIVDNITPAAGRVYAGLGKGGLAIVDLLEPAQPQLAGIYETGGFVSDIEVVGERAFVSSSPIWDGSTWTGSNLQILDIANPAAPALLASYDTPGWEMGVAVSGDTAYVADGDGGVQVLDVSDPTSPWEVGNYITPGPAMAVAVSDNRLYVADFIQGLLVLDITARAEPTEIGALKTAGHARRLTVQDSIAYVSGEEAGVSVVDVSQAAAPALVDTIAPAGDIRDVAVRGEQIYLADRKNGLHIWQNTQEGAPVQVGYFDTLGHVDGIAVLKEQGGDVLAVVASGDNLRTMRLPKKGDLEIVARYETAGKVEDVAVDKTHETKKGKVYIVAVAEAPQWLGDSWSQTGLRMYEVDDEQRLQEISYLPLPGETHKLDIEKDTAYVAAGSGGLRMIDLSDPKAPQESGYFVSGDAVLDVAVGKQDCVYMSTGDKVIDLCQGDQPEPSASLTGLPVPTPNPRSKPLQVSGLRPFTRKFIDMYALVYSDDVLRYADMPVEDPLLWGDRSQVNRLRELDAAKTNKKDAGELFDTSGQVQGMTMLANDIYIADGDGGIVLLMRGGK